VAGRIRQEDVQEVRDRTDIVKLIGQYLTLKKAGHDSLSGICPFHTEKTPSLSVSPAKQVFYCFGCGEHGDALGFLMKVESLSFPEAVERLARDAGIQLRYESESPADRRAAGRRQALHRANAEASGLFHSTLMEGKEGRDAREYLASRGIDRTAAEEFEIGYAPTYSDFLLRRLSGSFSPELLVEAGLAVRGDSIRDRFRGRITFPIHDLSGQHVAFGGRLLVAAEGQPKYLNTNETPVYRKGKVLYNLHRARADMTRSGRAVVVEGYTDVIALAPAGVPTAVATCGTALSEDHYQLLSRFATEVVLTFDADEAGARAAERAFAFDERFPVRTRVLVLPNGLDPADYVQKHGGEAFQELASRAVPLVEFMIERAMRGADLSSVEGRTAAVHAGLPIVAGLDDEVRRQEYASLLADRAGVSDSSVFTELERLSRIAGQGGGGPAGRRAPAPARESLSAGPTRSPQQRVEWDMLKLLAQSEDAFAAVAGELTDDHFERAGHRRLLQLLLDAKGDVRSLVAPEDEGRGDGETEDPKLAGQVAALATEPIDLEATAENAQRVWWRLEEFRLKRAIDALRRELQKINPVTDAERYDEMFAELARLTGAWRRAREQN
jgi:DNA primase